MKKKSIVAVVCVVLALAVFSGCREDDGVPTLIWWNVGTPQHGFARYMRIISDYVYEQIGVRLVIRQAGWGEAEQRFNVMINTGEYFDIMFVDGGSYARFAALGAFLDITDLVPEVAPYLWEYIPEALWDGVRFRGRIHAVPTYKDSSRTGLYFWDDYFVQKYDIDLTGTGWAFLDEVFRRMKEGEDNPRFFPFQMTRNSDIFLFDNYDGLSALLPPIGVRIDDESRRVVNLLEQPDIIEAFRFLHSWQRDGIINPNANMINEAPPGAPFFIAQAWPSVAYAFALAQGIERYHPVVFSGPIYSTGSIQGSMNAISVNSRHPEAALRFLQLVNSDTLLRDMLHMGIEGTHFIYVDTEYGRRIRRLRTDWPLVNFQQGSFFIQTPLEDVPPGFLDEIRHQNNTAFRSVMLGFMMDTEPVIREIMNARNVWSRYEVDLRTGVLNPDVILPTVIAELRDAGLDRIIEEAQRQVDEFARLMDTREE